MKKDGHFIVPLKKTEPVVFQAQETSLQTRLMVNFRAAKGFEGPRGDRRRIVEKRAGSGRQAGRRR
jgi:transcription elongation factor GreA-like protein